MIGVNLPAFVPHRLVRGGYAQTLAGYLFDGWRGPKVAVRHRVELDDGDQLVLHDDHPLCWRPGGRTALLVHGLIGCAHSPYMCRIGARLNEHGVRTFRLDLRGTGAGAHLARLSYYSGCSSDLAAALRAVERLCPGSPTALIGFSIGGNITLKLLGEMGGRAPGGVDRAMVVCAPVDLMACSRNVRRGMNRLFDRRFARVLYQRTMARKRRNPQVASGSLDRPPRGIWEFDERLTAPVWGYKDVAEYYDRCSAGRFVHRIKSPTLMLSAADDTLVPAAQYRGLDLPNCVHLHVAPGGGHLGFIGNVAGGDPDRRWLDWRVVDWTLRPSPR